MPVCCPGHDWFAAGLGFLVCEGDGGLSMADSVAAFARASARLLPVIFLWPGAHTISMW